MNVKTFKAYLPNEAKISDFKSFVDSFKDGISDKISTGIFNHQAAESLYIYSISLGEDVSRSVIGMNGVDELLAGKIIKHEHTLDGKTDVLKAILLKEKLMTKPIMVAVDAPKLSKILSDFCKQNKPFVSGNIGEELHEIFVLRDEAQSAILQILTSQEKVFVADGHHRLETYQSLVLDGPGHLENILTAYFPKEDLQLKAYHRGLLFKEEINIEQTIKVLEQVGVIVKLDHEVLPPKKSNICLFIDKQSYMLTFHDHIVEQNALLDGITLDLMILQDSLIPLLKPQIKAVDNIPGNVSVEELKDKSNADYISIALYPVAIKDMMCLTENNIMLPPKSTWFEPKTRSGMILGELK